MELGRLCPGITPEKADFTSISPEETEEDPDRGGLPGTVGTKEAVDLSGGDLEIEPVEGSDVTEALLQTGDGYGV